MSTLYGTRRVMRLILRRDRVLLPLSGKLFVLDRPSGSVRSLPLPGSDAVLDPRFSPDGRRVAFVYADDLWVVAVEGGAAQPVTTIFELGRSRRAFLIACRAWRLSASICPAS